MWRRLTQLKCQYWFRASTTKNKIMNGRTPNQAMYCNAFIAYHTCLLNTADGFLVDFLWLQLPHNLQNFIAQFGQYKRTHAKLHPISAIRCFTSKIILSSVREICANWFIFGSDIYVVEILSQSITERFDLRPYITMKEKFKMRSMSKNKLYAQRWHYNLIT